MVNNVERVDTMKLKYMIVGFIAGVFAAVAMTAGASTTFEKFTAVARPDYTLVVDGEKVTLNTPPKTIDGVTHLPIREVATILDKNVNFNSGTITLTSKLESEGDKVTAPTTETNPDKQAESTVSSEWISLRELAEIGIIVQVDPNNVITVGNDDNALKFYSTDIVKNETTQANMIDGNGIITIKSDKGLTYLKKSELRSVGIID
jgi:hypothetical protein